VAFPPGGSADIIGRALAKKMTEKLNQAVVVENVAGGAGVPAAMRVLRGPADGYTLMIGSDTNMTINGFLLSKIPYDSVKDFTPITIINSNPHWLVVKNSSKFTTFEEFVQYIQKNPGKVSIAVNGVGSSGYLALMQWAKDNSLEIV